MNKVTSVSIAVIMGAGLIFLCAVCWHSVGEIHYLKSFFPATFTVEQACLASVVELIKVAIISLPVIVGMSLGLYVLKNSGGR